MPLESPILNEQDRTAVVEKLRAAEWLHRWDRTEIVKHIAYLVPKCNIKDLEQVLRRLRLDPSGLFETVSSLQGEKFLAQETVEGKKWVFYLQQDARTRFEAWLKEQKAPQREQPAESNSLETLVAKVVDPRQSSFLAEIIKCLNAGANRAAIIMAWNLAYDHLRHWVYKRRLSAFNGELTIRFRRKGRTYDQITRIDDFEELRERLVLEVCEKAQLIDGHQRDVLFEGMKERNRFAHPSSAEATAAIAAGHIKDLLENVVLNDKFAW